MYYSGVQTTQSIVYGIMHHKWKWH